MTGEDTDFAGADRRVIELAPGRSIGLRVHVSFLTSLFQQMGAQIRKLRIGAIRADARNAPLSRFAIACPPIEILRWGEYAARDAVDVAEIEHSVRHKVEGWAADLAAAIESLAEDYKHGTWPKDQTALLETQLWLARTLPAIKDDIILGLRRGLALAEDDRPVDVVLVRQAYDLAGAHSHPALVDTSRFAGADLVEVLFHEIGHELLDRSVGFDQSGIAILNRALGTGDPHQVTVYDLLHIVLFAQVGSLVRQHFDRAHRPLIYRAGRLARMLQKMHVSAPQPDVVAMLDRHAAGQINLDELAQFFTRHSAP